MKFSRIIEANEAYIVVCLEDDDVDKTISTRVNDELKDTCFDVVVPPPLRAKKSIIVRRLDQEVTSYSIDEIKQDIEERNIWAKTDEVVKMRNISVMLKIRFKDTAMARKAISSGLCLFTYRLSPNQTEQEEFYPLLHVGLATTMTIRSGTVLIKTQ